MRLKGRGSPEGIALPLNHDPWFKWLFVLEARWNISLWWLLWLLGERNTSHSDFWWVINTFIMIEVYSVFSRVYYEVHVDFKFVVKVNKSKSK